MSMLLLMRAIFVGTMLAIMLVILLVVAVLFFGHLWWKPRIPKSHT